MSEQKHILAVGDLHGRFDLLQRVLGEVLPGMPAGSFCVFLGDYIDRGPDSAKVVAALMEFSAQHPETVTLMGNHEEMLLNSLDGLDPTPFLWNGGRETLASYRLREDELAKFPLSHAGFIKTMPRYFASGGYIFAHAGLRPGLDLDHQNPRDFLWIREEFFESGYRWEQTIVFGHTPFPEPLIKPGLFGIDTGAVYGNKLTCLKLPEEELIFLS